MTQASTKKSVPSTQAIIHRKMIANHVGRVTTIIAKDKYCEGTKSMIRRLHNQEVHTLLYK